MMELLFDRALRDAVPGDAAPERDMVAVQP